MPEPPQAATPRLSLLTIGGFLGAGKTTLVNALLRGADGRRIVVFVNDFGAINIDVELVETVAEDRVALSNGCVCCTLNDDFVASVAAFAREASPPDAIVVEASGVADPRALDASLVSLEAAGLIRAELGVYVVDADQFGQLGYADTELVIDHAAASDLLLLNKADLAGRERIDELSTLFVECAPRARVLPVLRCDVPLDLLLDAPPVFRDDCATQPLNHALDYVSWSTRFSDALDRGAFDAFAAELARNWVRAKGFVRFTDAPDACLRFDLVGRRATLEPASPAHEGVLVAIGLANSASVAEATEAFARVATETRRRAEPAP